MEAAISQLIGSFIGCFIWSLIGAVILRAAAKWVQNLEVGFGNAYVTVLLSALANLGLGCVIGIAVGIVGRPAATEETLVLIAASALPVGFLIQSRIVSSRLQIPFGRGCLVSLAMIGVTIGISLVVGLILFVITRLV